MNKVKENIQVFLHTISSKTQKLHIISWYLTWISYIVDSTGFCSFYRCEFDPVAGGEMKQLECHFYLKTEENH